MGFLRPELLLLALPALWVWHRTRERSTPTQVARLLALVLLLAAVAAPYLETGSLGRDLIFVVDRSLSMPAGSEAQAQELIRLAAGARAPGDRLGVVTFGRHAAVESLPDDEGVPDRFERELDPGGSDLAQALETALSLIPENRAGGVLLISDGENNGRELEDVARRAFARGLRVDVTPVRRPQVPDISVDGLVLPDGIAVGVPFQFSAWVHADSEMESGFVLRRNGVELSRGEQIFSSGMNRLLFRDVLERGGIAAYELNLIHPGDRIAENNHGLGATTAYGPPRLLVLNNDGEEDTLVRTLRQAELAVEVRSPEAVRLSPVTLSAWRAVIIENVSARRIGRRGLRALEDFVVERGGGLFMTGGKAAFGVGGYHLTPIDELLPVSMELRDEHRKQGVSLVLVLDRSGSMGASAGPGLTKMDLANNGSAAAIALLSSIDSVGILAVDTTAHTVQALTAVDDVTAITKRALGIASSGGGIYTCTGLQAAADMLAASEHANRHIILFADAADAEEPEGVPALLAALLASGTTVSVIALGTEADSDAAFLRRVAEQGEGEIYFTTHAEELPQLFTQDTLRVARSTFVEEQTSVGIRPEIFGLGEIEVSEFPDIGGFNLNYLRTGASAAAVTSDEYDAPLLSYWYQGIGRSAAYCGQIGGSHGSEVVEWEGFSSLFVTLTRWLVGQEEPTDLFVTAQREGSAAVISVEVDPEAATPPDTAQLSARLRSPSGLLTEHLLERVGEQRFEARVKLEEPGVLLGTIRLADGRFENLPPIVLPYSPEFKRVEDPEAGHAVLRELARATNGEVAPAAHTLFRGERQTRAFRVISRELLLIALVLFLFEIALRRLGLWGLVRDVVRRIARRAPRKSNAESSPQPGAATPAGRARGTRAIQHTPPTEAEREKGGARIPGRNTGAVQSALDRARQKAGRKLDR